MAKIQSEQYTSLNLNLYDIKIKLISEAVNISEITKYYREFITCQANQSDYTFYFIINRENLLAEMIRSDKSVEEKWKDVFFIQPDDKTYLFLIPDLGYPMVLTSQILNITTYDWFPINKIMPVHAGAISDNEKALLFIGEKRSGKTTLSLALAKHGYKLFSDDIALLNWQSEILPYFRGITPRQETVHMFQELKSPDISHKYTDFDDRETRWCVELEQAMPRGLSKKCKLSYIIFPKYRPDLPFQVTEVSINQAIVQLMKNMKCIPTLTVGTEIISILNNILKGMPIYNIIFSNSRQMIDFIDNLYGRV